MVPHTPPLIVSSDSSAQKLLKLGKPFVEFPKYSILELQNKQDFEGNPVPFSEWLTKRLQGGRPFVIEDFQQLHDWDPKFFDIEKLIELSTKKNIPIRNCSTGRDLSFTLRKFADSARQSYQEFQNLYARDLQCPTEWLERCRKILPTEVQWGGRLDLFQWLPPPARSEVMMAYVGSEGSASGFHRCFSSTVALNLLVDSDDRPVVCIGTDFESQKKYDTFMSARGISPHIDWTNLATDQLLTADFPLYVYDQKVGDLVVFPPATAHQVWNPATLSTKLVWNILHPLSLEVGFQYVQPPFNRLCHPDVARTNLSLACAMVSLTQEDSHIPLPPDLPLLSRLFRQMVHDESIEGEPATAIQLVKIENAVIATCNFCQTAIWNRHVRCTECDGFDLCLACYLNGRSCEHSQSYVWAEIVPQAQCSRVLSRAREVLGFRPEEPRVADRCKTLGTAVNDLMKAKQTSVLRLCHLCRIEHAEWKGRRCDGCTAFFCYRGLFRHFDINSADVLKHTGMWTCPKCGETCNCRCCHFNTAYVKSEKPASKRRVRPCDARGKIMGFTDNVFDQKRGHRNSNSYTRAPGQALPGVAQVAGHKRSFTSTEIVPATPLRKFELPNPETDPSRAFDMRASREGSDYLLDAPFASARSNGRLPGILPSLNTFSEQLSYSSTPHDDRTTPRTSPGGVAAWAATAVSRAGEHQREITRTTLPPMLTHPPAVTDPFGGTALSITATATTTPLPHHANAQIQKQPQLFDYLDHRSSKLTTEPSMPTSTLDAQIRELEERIGALRKYEQEFMSLELEGSQKLLQAEIRGVEDQIKNKKREKSLVLIERLEKDGLRTLADGVRTEMAAWPGG